MFIVSQSHTAGCVFPMCYTGHTPFVLQLATGSTSFFEYMYNFPHEEKVHLMTTCLLLKPGGVKTTQHLSSPVFSHFFPLSEWSYRAMPT